MKKNAQSKKSPKNAPCIRIKGARQHNLKDLNLEIPLGKLTVITGPSGSGKSSLAFHTLYAEGQRRYVETFSPYVRQFLDRMDKPIVDRIDGIPPAIAIEQKNTIRSTRSSVGTLTELNDYLKLLFPHLSSAFDPVTGEEIKPDTPSEIGDWCMKHLSGHTLVLFPLSFDQTTSPDDIFPILEQQGFTRIHFGDGDKATTLRIDSSETYDLWNKKELPQIFVVQDRINLSTPQQKKNHQARLFEAIESAITLGKGNIRIFCDGIDKDFSTLWTNPNTGFSLSPPTASLFSFNSPLGACSECRGFGRTIGIDLQKAIPNTMLSIADGCIAPFTSPRGLECQADLLRAAKRAHIDIHTPYQDLSEKDKHWLLYGDFPDDSNSLEAWENNDWYGVKGFFDWLETKAYKMHVRVFLSRYRAYTTCHACHGTRLTPEALCFKIDGKSLPDLWKMPIVELTDWFDSHFPPSSSASHSGSVLHALSEIQSRLHYLCQVGLGYLTLDRPANTLSGGEIERVNLTTCLGASLTNTLFVLDEPTVGLHQRDIDQLIRVMHDLRDKGNTVVVVEHEETVMRACDHLIDLGPAAGEHGGYIVAELPGNKIHQTTQTKQFPKSQTLPYLSGTRSIPQPSKRRVSNRKLVVKRANKHNIKNLDFELPLGTFTCLTGVSGSGKSTLAHDVIYLNLAKLFGITNSQEAAPITSISGFDLLEGVELVDQSPLTRTPRSTPAVYSGAFDAIRLLYALTPKAVSNDIKPGYFFFNSGDGRCQRCMGNGFEKVEMQFLSDLYITCPECEGTRYTQTALSYRYAGKNMAETLQQTINESVDFASTRRNELIQTDLESSQTSHKKEIQLLQKIILALQPIIDVGLGYLKLGQPLNTLSGGESQRLKLCQILNDAQLSKKSTSASKRPSSQNKKSPRGKLIILDEPTTGLHFGDIANLLVVFHRLVDAGHSLLVIEHQLDVIRSADHLIDLGPGAGNLGGNIVFAGTPEQLIDASISSTHTSETAKALRGEHASSGQHDDKKHTKQPKKSSKKIEHSDVISIHGAREHNLKNISLDIPRDELVVVTGLSGSGKSTLAFDIVFAEGQRRFLDSMSPYARQFAGQLEKPDIDRITGLPPTVAIEQRVSRGGGKSTTGTVTEIYHFLRLLYAKLGIQHCPESNEPVVSQTREAIEQNIQALEKKHKNLLLLAPLIRARKGYHTDVAKAAQRKGISQLLVDGSLVFTEDFKPLARYKTHDIFAVCSTTEQALLLGNGTCAVMFTPKSKHIQNFSTHRVSPVTGQSFEELDPHHFSFNSHRGWCPVCRGYGVITEHRIQRNTSNHPFNSELEAEIHETLQSKNEQELDLVLCPDCHGARLKESSRHVLIFDTPIHKINQLTILEAIDFLKSWSFTGRDKIIARDILPEIIQRLEFLNHVGLGYLQLDRSANTLSGGESQRIRLAAQLGSNLRGVLYVLDEPTIGLHPRDNVKLLDTLIALRDRGNSLLVVEHDDETIARASHLITLGPGAGVEGGQLTPVTTKQDVSDATESSRDTNKKQKRYPRRPIPPARASDGWIRLTGCHANNLKNIDVRIPLGRLTVLSGVSGCGKSSLMRGCLAVAAKESSKSTKSSKATTSSLPYLSASGFDSIKHCFEVDQSPIGKTSRSCPATYVKLFDKIRHLFAQLPSARARGFSASRFSFNNKEGQCPECKGNGRIKLEMDFLPTTWAPCETCHEMRYNPATLDIRYHGKNIGEVLQMNIRTATEFFSSHPPLHKTLALLNETGLGYLQLGQASPTLSGGEAQRIKLISELTKGRKSPTKNTLGAHHLYLIEEPSIGLHQQDVEQLIAVLHKLVDEGHTVVVIEHHTSIMATADYLIDLGPEAGNAGGKIITQGTPEHVSKSKTSHTAVFLRKELAHPTNKKNKQV